MMQVQPSPCLIVSHDTLVGDVLKAMVDNQNNYVLIQDTQGRLSGIFTDHDLLKHIQALRHCENQERPISVYMSRPVKTLSVNLIHVAGEYMLKHNIRHVPIVKPLKGGGSELLGVVTDRSIFSAMIRRQGLPPLFGFEKTKKSRHLLGVLSPNGSLYFTLDKVFENSNSIDLQRYHFSQLNEPDEVAAASRMCDAVFVDIDDAPSREWVKTISLLMANPNLEAVCVFYSPDEHEGNVVGTLQTIKSKGGAFVYEKPLDVAQILLDLEEAWS